MDRRITRLLIVLVSVLIANAALAKETIRLGYIEGGKYPIHDAVRTEFQKQLQLNMPDSLEIIFDPSGFRSANWHRDTCRMMAENLAALEGMDIIVAMGPWVVEDLLAAGCKKPILAMHRFNAAAEGLIGTDGRPIADNLTVDYDPDQLKNDLTMFSRLKKIRKLGILYFATGDEHERLIVAAREIGNQLGFEVVTAEGYDNAGTFAFFKAYPELDRDVDAIYLPPMWGLDIKQANEFLSRMLASRKAAYTSEGRFFVERGAFASDAGYSYYTEGRRAVDKLFKIIDGATPADLPVIAKAPRGLSINLETADKLSIEPPIRAINDAFTIDAPPPSEATHFSLVDAVARAEQANPGILSRYDLLTAAGEAASQARAAYLPQINAGAAFSHFDDNTVYNARELIDQDRWVAGISLDQLLLSLQTVKNIKLAGQQKDFSQIELKQSRIDLELAVAAAYLNYLQAYELLQVEKQNRDLIDRGLIAASTLEALGQKKRQEYLRWEDERTIASQTIIEARTNLKAAEVLLKVLINLPADAPINVDDVAFDEERFYRDYSALRRFLDRESAQRSFLDYLVQSGLNENPQVLSHKNLIEQQQTLLGRNRARYLPTVGFQAQLNWRDELADRLNFKEEKTTWNLSAHLRLPLFEGTDRVHEGRKIKARISSFEFERDNTSLKVMGAIETTGRHLLSAYYRVPMTSRSQSLARQNYELTAAEYEAGNQPQIDLLDAIAAVHRAESSYVVTRYRFYLTLATLVHEVGWASGGTGSDFVEMFIGKVAQ